MYTIQTVITATYEGEYIKGASTDITSSDAKISEQLLNDLPFRFFNVSEACSESLATLIMLGKQHDPNFDVQGYLQLFLQSVHTCLENAESADLKLYKIENTNKN